MATQRAVAMPLPYAAACASPTSQLWRAAAALLCSPASASRLSVGSTAHTAPHPQPGAAEAPHTPVNGKGAARSSQAPRAPVVGRHSGPAAYGAALWVVCLGGAVLPAKEDDLQVGVTPGGGGEELLEVSLLRRVDGWVGVGEGGPQAGRSTRAKVVCLKVGGAGGGGHQAAQHTSEGSSACTPA